MSVDFIQHQYINENSGYGIMGGTFDPIHHGHLRLASEVVDQLKLSKLYMTPSKTPPHRDTPSATPKHRLKMVELATSTNTRLEVCRFEIEQTETSYSLNTVKHLRNQFPDTPLVFILGSDAFLEFDTWHQWQSIIDYVHIAVVCRPGFTLNNQSIPKELKGFVNDHTSSNGSNLHTKLQGHLFFMNTTMLDISSTGIRNFIEQNQNIDYLLPETVVNYIQTNNLYKSM